MRRLAVLVSLCCALALAAHAMPEPTPFAVIVADTTPHLGLQRDAIAQIYRRKLSFWKDGRRIQPANLPANDPLRRAFSECVLGQAPDAMEDYWREMYFHGVLPPHVVASEQAMLLFVLSTPGAIGYVSTCPVDARITVLMTVGDVPNCPKRNTICTPLQE